MEWKEALRSFDVTAANLAKLERIWPRIRALIPEKIEFGSDGRYEEECELFREVLKQIPAIGDSILPDCLIEYDEIAATRSEYEEFALEAPFARVDFEKEIFSQGDAISTYKRRFRRARRDLTRLALNELLKSAELEIRRLFSVVDPISEEALRSKTLVESDWNQLSELLKEIEVLAGDSIALPDKWADLKRHIAYGENHDLIDIVRRDWPAISSFMNEHFYAEDEPIPLAEKDLLRIAPQNETGRVYGKYRWETISPEEFEEVVFHLVRSTGGYENVSLQTHINASDRGRDIGCFFLEVNPLCGTDRKRVVIQCKHKFESSIGLPIVNSLVGQMSLWGDPPVDVLIIVTSGHFTTDAVQFVEKHNASDKRLRIYLWPKSHLESLLAQHPAIVGQFNLRL